MSPIAGFDLAPVLGVLVAGVLLAAGPLVWWRVRRRDAAPGARLHAFALMTLFLCFDLVLFGAFTRLSDSGLGCPDWPGCYGHASPLGAHAPITAAQAAIPTGAVTPAKAWIEMVHRYGATAIGLLIIALVVLAVRAQRRGVPGVATRWAWLTLFWVCLQGAFGALHRDACGSIRRSSRCTCSAAWDCSRCSPSRPSAIGRDRWRCRPACARRSSSSLP